MNLSHTDGIVILMSVFWITAMFGSIATKRTEPFGAAFMATFIVGFGAILIFKS